MSYIQRVKFICFRLCILFLKKSENLSSIACRLVQITGKHPDPIHPKHLIQARDPWYLQYINKNDVVIDIGCHNGQNTLKIAKFCKRIYGIDNNMQALNMAKNESERKKIKNAFFKQFDVENRLPFTSKLFDKVILLDVLEHIVNRNQLLKEIKRVLKNNGLLLLSIPNSQTSWKKLQRKFHINSYSDPDHKIEYSRYQINSIMHKSGFNVINIFPVVYDTSLVGFIDLIGGISLSVYKKLVTWRRNKALKNPQESIGLEIVCGKKV